MLQKYVSFSSTVQWLFFYKAAIMDFVPSYIFKFVILLSDCKRKNIAEY